MNIYTDSTGKKYEKAEAEPVIWRISSYGIIEKNDSLLMVVPTWNDQWELPGGGVDAGESL